MAKRAERFESLHIHHDTRPLNCGNAAQGPCRLSGVSDTCRIGGTSWPQIGPDVMSAGGDARRDLGHAERTVRGGVRNSQDLWIGVSRDVLISS